MEKPLEKKAIEVQATFGENSLTVVIPKGISIEVACHQIDALTSHAPVANIVINVGGRFTEAQDVHHLLESIANLLNYNIPFTSLTIKAPDLRCRKTGLQSIANILVKNNNNLKYINLNCCTQVLYESLLPALTTIQSLEHFDLDLHLVGVPLITDRILRLNPKIRELHTYGYTPDACIEFSHLPLVNFSNIRTLSKFFNEKIAPQLLASKGLLRNLNLFIIGVNEGFPNLSHQTSRGELILLNIRKILMTHKYLEELTFQLYGTTKVANAFHNFIEVGNALQSHLGVTRLDITGDSSISEIIPIMVEILRLNFSITHVSIKTEDFKSIQSGIPPKELTRSEPQLLQLLTFNRKVDFISYLNAWLKLIEIFDTYKTDPSDSNEQDLLQQFENYQIAAQQLDKRLANIDTDDPVQVNKRTRIRQVLQEHATMIISLLNQSYTKIDLPNALQLALPYAIENGQSSDTLIEELILCCWNNLVRLREILASENPKLGKLAAEKLLLVLFALSPNLAAKFDAILAIILGTLRAGRHIGGIPRLNICASFAQWFDAIEKKMAETKLHDNRLVEEIFEMRQLDLALAKTNDENKQANIQAQLTSKMQRFLCIPTIIELITANSILPGSHLELCLDAFVVYFTDEMHADFLNLCLAQVKRLAQKSIFGPLEDYLANLNQSEGSIYKIRVSDLTQLHQRLRVKLFLHKLQSELRSFLNDSIPLVEQDLLIALEFALPKAMETNQINGNIIEDLLFSCWKNLGRLREILASDRSKLGKLAAEKLVLVLFSLSPNLVAKYDSIVAVVLHTLQGGAQIGGTSRLNICSSFAQWLEAIENKMLQVKLQDESLTSEIRELKQLDSELTKEKDDENKQSILRTQVDNKMRHFLCAPAIIELIAANGILPGSHLDLCLDVFVLYFIDETSVDFLNLCLAQVKCSAQQQPETNLSAEQPMIWDGSLHTLFLPRNEATIQAEVNDAVQRWWSKMHAYLPKNNTGEVSSEIKERFAEILSDLCTIQAQITPDYVENFINKHQCSGWHADFKAQIKLALLILNTETYEKFNSDIKKELQSHFITLAPLNEVKFGHIRKHLLDCIQREQVTSIMALTDNLRLPGLPRGR